MSTRVIDFSQYETKPKIDFAKYEKPDVVAPVPTVRGLNDPQTAKDTKFLASMETPTPFSPPSNSPLALKIAAGYMGMLSPASKVVNAASKATPSARIGEAATKFKDVEKSIGEHAVQVTDKIAASLSEMKEGIDTGLNAPSVVNKFVERIADTTQPPLTFTEARKFYSNLGDLATSERMAANSKMQRLIYQLRSALGESIEATAEYGGKLSTFQEAMKGFAKGMRTREKLDIVKKYAERTIGASVLGAAGYAGYRTLRDLVGGQ